MGCNASGAKWYKKGAYQADFDRDCVECNLTANSIAKEMSVSGNTRNFKAYIKAYNTCLFSKGWSHTPPGRVSGDNIPRLCRIQGNRISGFGRTFVLPKGFSVLRRTAAAYGPTLMNSVFCQRPDSVFLNIIFQASGSSNFEKIDYPVTPPFFLFDKGSLKAGQRWNSFCGIVNKEWVGGVGAYLNITPKSRIVVVATKPLPAQVNEPPPGLRVTKAQYKSLAGFTKRVCQWINKNFSKS